MKKFRVFFFSLFYEKQEKYWFVTFSFKLVTNFMPHKHAVINVTRSQNLHFYIPANLLNNLFLRSRGIAMDQSIPLSPNIVGRGS
jgi:hypothetical protein